MFHNFDFQKASSKIHESTVRKLLGPEYSQVINSLEGEQLNIINILKVLTWTNSKKIIVEFGWNNRDYYVFDDKKITINSKATFEHQCFSLLHECGHYLIFESAMQNPISYKERFSHGYFIDLPESTRVTYGEKISVIAEEIEAWVRGFNLSKRLGIILNNQSFEDYKVKCLRTYVDWASTPKR